MKPSFLTLKKILWPISVGASLLYGPSCQADCVASGSNVTCSGTTTQGYTASTNNINANILSGSFFSIARTPSSTTNWAISLLGSSQASNNGSIQLSGTGASGNRGSALLANNDQNTLINTQSGVITVQGSYNNALSANGNYNTLINHGSISTTGSYGYGLAAPWGQGTQGTQTNNTAINSGSITTSGSNARAISILGGLGRIENTGSLITKGSSADAVYMQGNNITLTNNGLIHAQGSGSNGVFSNTVSSAFVGTISNGTNGQIISSSGSAIKTLNGPTTITNEGLLQGIGGNAITGGNGNVNLILQTGSKIIGTVQGGANSNTKNSVILEGSGVLDNPFSNFQTLRMVGQDWTWQGQGDFQNSNIEHGTFLLKKSYTGNVTVHAGSELAVAPNEQVSLQPAPGQSAPITVSNSGLINLSTDSATTGGSLRIEGNYVGNNGVLQLNTTLNADDSPSNQLIISQGMASGKTSIAIQNVHGTGAVTDKGILIVQAINGANTDQAFTLKSPVAAGPYEYLLFKDPSTENWYLRSAFTGEPPVPLPPPTPEATPQTGSEIIFYRPETALYSSFEPVIKQSVLSVLGTFHERRGEQSLLTPAPSFSSKWLRVFGEGTRQNWGGVVSPRFKGSNVGLQTGVDLLSLKSANKHQDLFGILGAYNHIQGSVNGNVLGWVNYETGHLNYNGWSLGGYWTHITPQKGYVDAVIMNTWFNGKAQSNRDTGININKNIFLLSMESGSPFLLSSAYQLTIEPQAQLIWQNIPIIRAEDRYSHLTFQTDNTLTGRLGFRLQTALSSKYGVSNPYFKTNFWKQFSHINTVFFANDAIGTLFSEEALEIGGGMIQRFTECFSAFATTGYTFDVEGAEQRTWSGNAGLKVLWD